MAQTTKKMLAYTLRELLKTKPLSKVTINDITSKCGINRMTFYYHFKDIYELLEWMIEDRNVIPLENNIYGGDWWETLLRLAENALENKKIILNIYNSVGRDNIEQYFMRIFGNVFSRMTDKLAEGKNIADEDKEFVTYFYNKAVCGLVLDWLRGGMQVLSEKQINRLKRMLDGNMEFSLENMRRDKN